MGNQDEVIEGLRQIVDELCIELKKDNSIAARRNKAKIYREKAAVLLEDDPRLAPLPEREAPLPKREGKPL